MRPSKPPIRFVLVHLLPFLHLCACLAITLEGIENGWQYLILIDFPISLVGVMMMFRCDGNQIWCHPLIWFGILGTLWWYLLSRIAEYVFTVARGSWRPPRSSR